MTTVAPQVWGVSGTPQGYSGNGNGAGMSPDTQTVGCSKGLCPEPAESNTQDAEAGTETLEAQRHS